MATGEQVTRLLAALRQGDPHALGELFPLVYHELRELAHRQLRREGRGTLNTTAVVHEAYLRFLGPGFAPEDRSHFFNVAARAMRQILIDHARRHLAQKRGGGAPHTLLDENDVAVETRAEELIDLDTAMGRLGQLDERLSRVVELRFFAGLSVDETADTLGIGVRTVKRDWRKARAFLYAELHGDAA
ncbi:MAG TPA: sigma-70 family RNA polymerase sigma factor [bacterium]|nr:sigma-70 family RNA polymerase sigma factor [bacterium]